MLSARGRILLFVDADGATQFSDIEKLEEALASSVANRWVIQTSLILCLLSIFFNYTEFRQNYYRIKMKELSKQYQVKHNITM